MGYKAPVDEEAYDKDTGDLQQTFCNPVPAVTPLSGYSHSTFQKRGQTLLPLH